MIKKIFFPIFIILFLLSACVQDVPGTPSPTPTSGIEGQVIEGPMCPGPVAIGGNNCPDQPYQATISILDANNKPMTQFQTDSPGYFKIVLPPGTYILHPETDKPFPHAADQSVTVRDGQYTQVTIMYDTGMR
jgi:hypothetical protein